MITIGTAVALVVAGRELLAELERAAVLPTHTSARRTRFAALATEWQRACEQMETALRDDDAPTLDVGEGAR